MSSSNTVSFTKVAFIYNPKAFKGKAAEVINNLKPKVEKAFGDRLYKFIATEKPGDGFAKAKLMIEEGADLVVACGGDGTVHEIVNGLMDPETRKAQAALGVLPLGTGNDFAKTLHLTRREEKFVINYDRIIKQLAEGHTIQADLGHIESTHYASTLPNVPKGEPTKKSQFFNNIASLGISADVMHTVNNQGSYWISKDFTFSYLSLARQFTYQSKKLRTTIDNSEKPTSERISQLVAICNGQYFGSGMQVGTPKASLVNGKFNVTSFGDPGFIGALSIVPRLYKGTVEELKDSLVYFNECTNCVKVENVESKDRVFIETDGELFGELPATFTVVPGAITIVVSSDCPDLKKQQTTTTTSQ